MSEFRREDRYLVIKYSDMAKAKPELRHTFLGSCRKLHDSMLSSGAPARSFLVIESDWPEYEPAWQMIERRMTGKPAFSAAEELDAVRHWRSKYTQAIREREALQARLKAPTATHPFAEKVIRKLERFQECADDGQGADIGRHWFDLLTQLGLLNRVQRSPALWEMTQQGEDALELSRQSAKSR